MKTLKKISYSIFIFFGIVTFSQCSSAQKLEKEAPFKIKEAYYQSWVSGVKGGGSGVNVFIEGVSISNKITLDSLFFHGRRIKLEILERENILAIGRFKSNINEKRDIIMSSEPYAEYGNQVPEIPEKIPFQLKEDECVISYKDGNTIKYFKVDNMLKKESQSYP